MDPSDGSDLIERSGRLLLLTNALNLEDLVDKCGRVVCRTIPDPLYPFVQDFWRLRQNLRERQRLVCVYGVDSPMTTEDPAVLFGKMRVLSSQLFTHMQAAAAYCALKSQLCLEANDFFDEVFSGVDCRLKSCVTEEETERLLQVIFRLKNVYAAYLC